MYEENQGSHNWLAKRLLNRAIVPRLSLLRGIVVDLGCGSRPFHAEISRHAGWYIGVDWSKSMHDLRADVVADLNQSIPLADGVADGVVSFEVVEHLRNPRVLLGEASRILRPGGVLLLTIPFQWRVHEAPWDYCRYTRFGLQELLESAGFTRVEISPTTGFWSMWLLKLCYRLSNGLDQASVLRRSIALCFLVPSWWILQRLALLLDRGRTDNGETAGYVAFGVKPVVTTALDRCHGAPDA